MRLQKDSYVLIIILIILVLQLVGVSKGLLSTLTNPQKYGYTVDLVYGRFPIISLILVIVAILSIFVEFKFNWILASLPFLHKLFWPFEALGIQQQYYGTLINSVNWLMSGDVRTVFVFLLQSLLPVLVITYLFIKGIKKIDNKKFENIFAISILILFVLGDILIKFFIKIS